MREADIRTVVAGVLAERFDSEKLLGCDVEIDEDFDGASVIRVTARLDQPASDPIEKADASIAIQDRLKESGETRFVYLNIVLPQDDISNESDDEPGGMIP